MKFIAVITVLTSLTLSGCQIAFEETQYEPLIKDNGNGLAVNSDLTSRSIQGPLQNLWIQEIEPTIQDFCIQCHQNSDTDVSYGLSANDNLYQTLLSVKRHDRLAMSTNHHGELSEREQLAFEQFEYYAELYWPWANELEAQAQEANAYFEKHISSQTVQPICTQCHLVRDGQAPNLYLGLSFYSNNLTDHQRLNSDYSLSYLLFHEDAYLIADKATNKNYHGGGIVITGDSEANSHLYIHGNKIKNLMTKLEQAPF